LIKAVDLILQGMNPDAPESFRYFLVHFLNKYAKSKIVGMDAVYVHLVKEYYAKGYADWVDQEKLDKIIEEADRIAPTLIGNKAPEMMIQNLKTDEKFSIYDIESDYTILYFWDPDCGHCKKTTPKVIDFYKTYKDSSISIVAICTKLNTDAKPKCLEYIEGKEDMDLFINAFDPFLRSRYKQKYDIRSTPKVYILDKDKNILLKNIGGEQLKEVMDQVLSQNRSDQKSQIK
jgi:thiol-disulfide isomerase/thioredoxin